MPSTFKTLASVTVWILFVFGCLALVGGFVRAFSGARLLLVSAYFGYGIVSLTLSVAVAKLRQLMG